MNTKLYYIFTVTIILAQFLGCSSLPEYRSELNSKSDLELNKQLAPFISDGCSFFPEGTKLDKDKWLRCCIIHDLAYWAGGTKAQKYKADTALRKCVALKDESIISKMMYIGTRVGGLPDYNTDFKWGYGWRYQRGYIKLNNREREYIKKMSPKKGQDLRHFLNTQKISSEIKNISNPIYY